MIGIDRTTTKEPGALSPRQTTRMRSKAAEFFGDGSLGARQRQYEFDWAPLRKLGVLSSLKSVFSDRCAFCGRGLNGSDPIVHHLRPLQDAVAANGDVSRRHYYWLAYAWANLYLACRDCHRAQGAKFPVGGPRARAGTVGEGLEWEEPLLLDPCREDPEQFLIYLDSGEIVSARPRGRATIEAFDLNRPDLIRLRETVWERTRAEIEQAERALRHSHYRPFFGALRRLYDRGRPFAAQRRQLVNQWAQGRPRQIEEAQRKAGGDFPPFASLVGDLKRVTDRVKREAEVSFFGRPAPTPKRRRAPIVPSPTEATLGASLALQDTPTKDSRPHLETLEIREIEIRNFRAIDHLRLDIDGDPGGGSWLMLLGENGTGKSSVLQALALALGDPEQVRRLPVDHASLLRSGKRQGFVRVKLSGSRRELVLRFARDRESFVRRGRAEDVVMLGYGSTRQLPRAPGGEKRSAGAPSATDFAGLFDPFVPLPRPSDWLADASAQKFDAVAKALKRLLHLDSEATLHRTKRGIELTRGGQRLSLSQLSDGYQAMAGFGLDMMRVFIDRWGSLDAAEGIVLVDELGTHLHPRWQMKVTGSLREAFPRVQFIATTHDPLCLRGLRDGEVTVLRNRDNHVYSLQEELPRIEGLEVDQLLTSEHFGLDSTLDPEIEDLFERYYALLARRRRTSDANEELGRVTERLAGLRLLGTTRRERLALEAVDEFLAADREAKSGRDISRLTEQAKARVREIWETAGQ